MAADAKHTPGPWRTEDDAQGPTMVFGAEHGKAICSLTDAHIPANGFIGDDEGVGRPVRTANAHLIAAAPDLLAACERIAATWAVNGVGIYGGAIADQLLSAIAKAKGVS